MVEKNCAHMDEELVQTLSGLRYGLYFLCTGRVDDPRGMLVSWVSQVSGDPVLLMVAVRENRGLLPRLQAQAAYSLNILPAGDQELVRLLARPAPERFQGIELEEGSLGLPVLPKAAGSLCCRVNQVWRPGDHVLLVGEVQAWCWNSAGPVMGAEDTGHIYLGLQ